MSSAKHSSARTSVGRLRHLWAVISLLLIVSVACNLPFSRKQTDSTQTTPTTVTEAVDLPPTIVETDPIPQSVLALQGGIELTFDQPMERSSVEGAVSLQPAYSGRFEWADDSRIRFIPDQPLPADTTLTISVAATARSKNGQNLLRPQEFSFQTAGNLLIAEYFPANGLTQVDPGSSVAITFNQPVAPIGDASGAPPAFTIDPSVAGSGQWLNSSTYIFEPEISLGGGVNYTVHINPELTSLAGSPMASGGNLKWTFSTSNPEVVWINPEPGSTVWLEPEITLQFNQAMDRGSVEANLQLADENGKVYPGTLTWAENDTQIIFTPKSVLPRTTNINLTLSNKTKSHGGTELRARFVYPYQTIGMLAVQQTRPETGASLRTYNGYGSITLEFNAPLAKGQNLEDLVNISPQPVDLRVSNTGDGDSVYIAGFYESSQVYRVTVSENLSDLWGGKLGEAYQNSFRVADIEATFDFPMVWAANRVTYILPGEKSFQATQVNISSLDIRSAKVSLQEMMQSYDARGESLDFQPDQTWKQELNVAQNRSQTIDVGLTPDNSELSPGLYRYYVTSPQLSSKRNPINFWLVVSKIQLTMKISKNQVFVWAADLQTQSPVGGQRITIYDDLYNSIGSGVTDSTGIAEINILPSERYPHFLAAVTGEPGSPDFSAGFSFWQSGIRAYDFQLDTAGNQGDLTAYFYTDRPIYRPGQSVYFRGILREPADARYNLLEIETATVEVYGERNIESDKRPVITTMELPVSRYGTIDGEFLLPEGSPPGTYTIQLSGDNYMGVNFTVAEYRKPEIDLKVNFDRAEYRQGDDIHVDVAANYFFGAASSNSKILWTLYARDNYFFLPEGYTTGPLDTSWMQAYHYGIYAPLGRYVTSGDGTTDADGRLALTFTAEQLADLLKDSGSVIFTLEATLADETGWVLSQRGSAKFHPADFYIGIRSDNWGQAAGTSLGFSVQTTNWDKQPSGSHLLNATFQKVTWKADYTSEQMGDPIYTKELTMVAGSVFQTDGSGRARLEFTPKDPGTYQLEITGDGAVSQRLVWVGGVGTATWPRLPNQHLRIEADKQEYQAGETAHIFIPNPFDNDALALVTVERTSVLHSQVIEIKGPSQTVEIPLDKGDAPNVYVSVLLLGKGEKERPDFRLGYVNLGVKPDFLELQVDLIPETDKLAPGQTARAQIRVRDNQGKPVQGEFSLAVVDAAIFALAEPNAEDIREAYYGTQPLRVSTSESLVAYAGRILLTEPGLGGGGGGMPEPVAQLRKTFRDTAYWNATVETDVNGTAQIEFTVPDNLTTWVMTARGLTRDTLVGETTVNMLVSKDLLVRPVTPRFLVAGDRVSLGAVVHNNTDRDFEVKVALQAKGVQLEDPNSSEQTLQMTANSNQRVDWWVNVPDAGQAELIFSATGGGLQDATTPELGDLPILNYSSPMSFATNGVLAEGGETLEVVSLPRSFTPSGGQLSIEMSSTLAGTILSGMEAMKSFPYDFTEPILSRLLANLAVYDVLQVEGAGSPDLETQLQKEIRDSLDRLWKIQSADGGWGWSSGQKSDFYLSAYALLAVSRAKKANFFVESDAFTMAQNYVVNSLYSPSSYKYRDWELNRLALADYALRNSGYILIPTGILYEVRARLSPWAQALLAMSMGDGDSDKINQLLSDLQSTAIRSSTGANWEDKSERWFNHASPVSTTAMVILALAEKDPASALLTETVRYLSLHRRINGGWDCSFDTAWSIQALASVLKVTGDLQGTFAYSASINDALLASGQAAGLENLNPVRATVEIENLNPVDGNALRFQRDAGPGRLYYRAYLQVDAPVESAPAVDKGITISRRYSIAGVDCTAESCPTIHSISLGQFAPAVQVQLSITVSNEMYDLIVEDFIPAGAEIIDTKLLSSQRGIPQFSGMGASPVTLFGGWGWWYFNDPTIYDDHIRWVANNLPAGTYILTYDLQTVQQGEFRVLPAHAYAYYFPELEGRSQGEIFTITK